MMRVITAAYAICAALFLALGVFASTPADAQGYYRGGYQRAAFYRGPRGGAALVRTGYYGGRGYYGGGGYRTGYYGGGYRTGYYGGGSRTGYYGRPYGYGVRYAGSGYYGGGYSDVGYRDADYGDAGYTDIGYSGGYDAGYVGGYGYGGYDGGYAYGGCHTAYIPYGWTWYRASNC